MRTTITVQNTRGSQPLAAKGVLNMDVTTETFGRDVLERSHELPVVVDFWAAWCGPCRMLGPAIESEVAKREGKIELAKVDVEAEQMIAAQYGIQSIPTVVVFRDGEPVTGFVGAHPAEAIGRFLDQTIEQHTEEVEAA
jgi:putative thioredoxin